MKDGKNDDRIIKLPEIHVVGDICVKPGYVLETRTIDDFELVYFPAATKTVYESGGVSYPLDKPCVILTNPEESHRYRFDPDEPTRHLFAHFDMDSLRSQDSNFYRFMERKPFISGLPANTYIPSTFRQFMVTAHHKPNGWKRRLCILLYMMLEELASIAAEKETAEEPGYVPPPQIARALEYMEKHLHEQLTVEGIASSSGWSHEHFTRMFVKHLGITPQRALLESRIRRAEQLLVSEDWTIKRIACEIGFTDEHYLSRMFRQLKGVSASEFRRKYADPLLSHLAAVEDVGTPYPLNKPVIL